MREALGWVLLGALLGALAVGAWWRRAADRAGAQLATLEAQAASFRLRQARIDSTLRAGVARFEQLRARDQARADSLAQLEASLEALRGSAVGLRQAAQAARHALAAATSQGDSLGAAIVALAASEREADSLRALAATEAAAGRTWRARFEDQVRKAAQLEADQKAADAGRLEALDRVAQLELAAARLAAAPKVSRLLGFLPRPTCGPGVGVSGAALARLVRDRQTAAWEFLTLSCQLAL